MRNYPKLISEFYEVVLSFYNYYDGLYPIASPERVIQATNEYLEEKPLSQIYFDSFDREEVRKIIGPEYQII